MSSKNIHLGLRLLGAIRQGGFTQGTLAERIQTNPNHISRLVRSEDRLLLAKGQLLCALADSLNVSVDWLLGRTEAENDQFDIDEQETERLDAAAQLVSA